MTDRHISPRSPGWRQAFTLVELLVVIGIIALLISILLPSLNRARQSAQMTKCMSNMRQLGQANGFFMNDHNNYIVKPWFNDQPSIAAGWGPDGPLNTWGYYKPMWGWDYVLLGYVDGSKDVFECPGDTTPDQPPAPGIIGQLDPWDSNPRIRGEWNDGWEAGHPDLDPAIHPSELVEDNIPASYRHNSSNSGEEGPFFAMKITQVEHHTDGFFIVEALNSNFHHLATWEGNGLGSIGPDRLKDMMPFERHRDTQMQYLFYDGHAASLKWDDTWRPLSDKVSFQLPAWQGGDVRERYPTPWRTTYLQRSWDDVEPYEPDNQP